MHPASRPLASLAALALLALPAMTAACSKASAGDADAGDATVYYDATPFSCGTTDDCVAYGLTKDTCVFSLDGGCAAIGQCQALGASECAGEMSVCPCTGDTQMITTCKGGFATVPVLNAGGCSCAPSCANGIECTSPGACASGVCTNSVCSPPACSPHCPNGAFCGADTDCASGGCSGGKCYTDGGV